MMDSANAGNISGGDVTDGAAQTGDASMNIGNPSAMSPRGLEELKQREGFSETPYPDYKGFSIGYGHLMKASEDYTSITESDAAALLEKDVAWSEQAVSESVNASLTQNQFDALVSFVFNVGKNAFLNSTLLAKLNAGDSSAIDEFAKWNRAGGKVNQSLIARRESEVQQFEA